MPNSELAGLKENLTNYRANLQRTIDQVDRWLAGLELSIKNEEELISVKDDLAVLNNFALEHLQRSAEQEIDMAPILDCLTEQGVRINLSNDNKLNMRMPKEKMSPGMVAFLGEHQEGMHAELRRRGTDPAN